MQEGPGSLWKMTAGVKHYAGCECCSLSLSLSLSLCFMAALLTPLLLLTLLRPLQTPWRLGASPARAPSLCTTSGIATCLPLRCPLCWAMPLAPCAPTSHWPWLVGLPSLPVPMSTCCRLWCESTGAGQMLCTPVTVGQVRTRRPTQRISLCPPAAPCCHLFPPSQVSQSI
jgi:hypothetical protein